MRKDNQRNVDFEGWRQIISDVSSCQECLEGWNNEVVRSLDQEKPESPPPNIDTLFVGVAPTAQDGPNKGNHFYTSLNDNLRRGLFKILDEDFGFTLRGLGLQEGNGKFHEKGFFFVHACKVMPRKELAPPPEVIRYCAGKHLKLEIPFLNPRFVCFLGIGNASFAAEAVFQRSISGIPVNAVIPGTEWSGKVVVCPQPVRNRANRIAASKVLQLLWQIEGTS